MYDGNDKLNPEEIRAKIEGGDSESLEIILGTLEGDRKGELLDKLSLVVMSPGVPTDLPIVNEMREKGLPIWGEIELAYVFGKGDVLAITGTNGKTTTTSLLGEIMKNYAQSSFVVGNIGNQSCIKNIGDKQKYTYFKRCIFLCIKLSIFTKTNKQGDDNMNNRLGRQTVTFDNPPIIIETASTVGQKEGKGPLKSTFDVILDDDTLGEKYGCCR